MLYEKNLEFDSGELDLLEFDWKKDVDRVLLSRDKEEKLVNIDLHTGEAPILNFGYSHGDIQGLDLLKISKFKGAAIFAHY